MKVIDLLNKIANGEKVPKRILYEGGTYWYDELNKAYYTYICKDLEDEDISYLFDNCFASDILNDEVEVIEDIPKEEKKIEKLEATLNCIKDSETILGGEYYIVHSDFVIALEETIDRLNGDSNV